MEKYFNIIKYGTEEAPGLLPLALSRTGVNIPELEPLIELVIDITMQAGRDLFSKSDKIRNNAIEYLNSSVFIHRCKLISFDDDLMNHEIVKNLFIKLYDNRDRLQR